MVPVTESYVIDMSRLYFAGDSVGAQIISQFVNIQVDKDNTHEEFIFKISSNFVLFLCMKLYEHFNKYFRAVKSGKRVRFFNRTLSFLELILN